MKIRSLTALLFLAVSISACAADEIAKFTARAIAREAAQKALEKSENQDFFSKFQKRILLKGDLNCIKEDFGRGSKNCSAMNFSGFNFSGKDLTGINFSRSVFTNADFSNANLSQSIFEQADLIGAKLTNANTEGADFSKARMPDGTVNNE
jgi:uncharacterized protein YjbI with pentapeptide repeats